MSDSIKQIFSTKIDSILNNLVYEHSRDGHSAEKAMIGPFMSPHRPAVSSAYSPQQTPKLIK